MATIFQIHQLLTSHRSRERVILTKEFAVDLGSLRWVKPTFFVIGNRCVSVKIAVVLPAVVFSECKILHLISVVLCAVRAVLFFYHLTNGD